MACNGFAGVLICELPTDIAAQFGDFLKASMAPADYARLLPSLESLVGDYGMDPVRQLKFSLTLSFKCTCKLTAQQNVSRHDRSLSLLVGRMLWHPF